MASKRKINRAKSILKNLRLDTSLMKFAGNMAKRAAYRVAPSRLSLPWPTTFALELTNRCNLHCTMCPREHAYGKTLRPGQMDTTLAKRLLDEGLPYATSIGLTGMGETFLATNLLEVAQYAKKVKPSIVTFVSTNANFPGFLDRATPVLPYIDTLQVSIDGTGETYNRIRRGGNFDDLRSNLSRLVPLADQNGVDLMFNMVIDTTNHHAMADVITFAAEMGVRYVNFNYINLVSMPQTRREEYRFFRSPEYAAALAKVKEHSARYPQIEVTGLDLPTAVGFAKCPLLHNRFQVNVDGTVPPCCGKPFTALYSYGTVADGRTLRQVLNSPSAKQFRSHLTCATTPAFCRNCHFTDF